MSVVVATPSDLSALQIQIDSLQASVAALQTTVANLPPPTPPFDPTSLQNQINALDARLDVLEAGTPPPPPNRPPVWQPIPTITATQGVAQTFPIGQFASDPDGNPLVITKNSAGLPPGFTFDSPGKRFVYDGVGAAGSVPGQVLIADDGRP